jgi:hypothetical protein
MFHPHGQKCRKAGHASNHLGVDGLLLLGTFHNTVIPFGKFSFGVLSRADLTV